MASSASASGPQPLAFITPGIAIVTGASSGIGRATAIALSAAGWACVLSGRRADQLAETEKMIAAAVETSPKPLSVAGDLTEPGAPEALFDAAISAFGRVDLLFNNAGVASPGGPIDEIDAPSFERLLKINVTVPFICTSLAVKAMKQQNPQGGRIINNGSISSMNPRPDSAPYTLSKHAITGLTKSTALDGRAFRIACSQIDIGNAQSDLSAAASSAGHRQPSGQVVKEPMMDVRYAAHAVVYLASLPLDVNVLNQVRTSSLLAAHHTMLTILLNFADHHGYKHALHRQRVDSSMPIS